VNGAASAEQYHLHSIKDEVDTLTFYVERLLDLKMNLFLQSQPYTKS